MSLTTEETIPPNVIQIRRGKKGIRRSEQWRWTYLSSNGLTIARSSEGYANLEDLVVSLAQVLGVEPNEIIDSESWDHHGVSVERIERRYGRPVLVLVP
jgi:hypothetical protein